MNSTTPKYIVKIADGRYAYSPIAWIASKRAATQIRVDGKPTVENLRRWVASFEAATQPGGCNAHLGATKLTSARIVNNFTGELVASL
jgi:hypothetical protein